MATTITGAQKAAILMMTLGEEHCARLFEQMHEEEIREISGAMSRLGMVSSEIVEAVCHEFSRSLGNAEVLVGDFDTTERLLKNSLPPGKAGAIMEEIRGPAGRTMWDKLGNISEIVLANYLKNEYPQTVAVILSKIKAQHAAKILELLPEDFSMDVMTRILKTENIQKEVLKTVEQTLRNEFVSNISRGVLRDSHTVVADIFNNFDRRVEARFMSALEERNLEDAEKVRSLMFTFEELCKLSQESTTLLLTQINREILPIALKGSSDEVRKIFLSAMSERAGRILIDEIAALGPVRVKDVEAAQNEIIVTAKEMLDRGAIDLLDQQQPGNELIQ